MWRIYLNSLIHPNWDTIISFPYLDPFFSLFLIFFKKIQINDAEIWSSLGVLSRWCFIFGWRGKNGDKGRRSWIVCQYAFGIGYTFVKLLASRLVNPECKFTIFQGPSLKGTCACSLKWSTIRLSNFVIVLFNALMKVISCLIYLQLYIFY